MTTTVQHRTLHGPDDVASITSRCPRCIAAPTLRGQIAAQSILSACRDAAIPDVDGIAIAMCAARLAASVN